MTDLQYDTLHKTAGLLGEMFDDYMIIARPHKHGMVVHTSDSTWASGAIARFKTLQSKNDAKEESTND